jgi:uncharacterized protein DUF4260
VAIFTRPATLLRFEGAATLLLAAYLYSIASADWVLFVLLLVVPDVAILGYLRGSVVGAAVYNLLHTEIGPLLLAAGAVKLQIPLGLAIALVWLAHIGMDRMLGYGLKLTTGFRDTHLGRIGRAEIPPPREW